MTATAPQLRLTPLDFFAVRSGRKRWIVVSKKRGLVEGKIVTLDYWDPNLSVDIRAEDLALSERIRQARLDPPSIQAVVTHVAAGFGEDQRILSVKLNGRGDE